MKKKILLFILSLFFLLFASIDLHWNTMTVVVAYPAIIISALLIAGLGVGLAWCIYHHAEEQGMHNLKELRKMGDDVPTGAVFICFETELAGEYGSFVIALFTCGFGLVLVVRSHEVIAWLMNDGMTTWLVNNGSF